MITESIAKFLKLDSLIANLTGYVETKIELVKVEVKEELANSLSKAAVYILIGFVCAVFLLFLSLGIALSLSEQIGYFAGFASVAAFYLLLGIVLISMRKQLFVKFEGIIGSMLKKKKNK